MSRVSEFFKSMFRRDSSGETESSNRCQDCDCPLKTESMGPRLLERCPQCRGIWLSLAQLKEILDQVSHKVEEEMATVESDGEAEIAHTFAPERVKRSCPSCAQEMDNFKFENTGIWVDACQEHGIWLDQGELKLIAQRRQSQSEEQSDPGTVLDAVSDLILGSL